MPRERYYCKRCKKNHFKDTEIGIEHKKDPTKNMYPLNVVHLGNRKENFFMSINAKKTFIRIDGANYLYEGQYKIKTNKPIKFKIKAKNMRDLILKIKKRKNIDFVIFEEKTYWSHDARIKSHPY